MLIETRRLADLRYAEYNPRQSSPLQEEKLRSSLAKFGCVEPIVVNSYVGRENVIIGGHFRVRELKNLKQETVDCVIVNLNPADEQELNIRLNANTGEWDNLKLKEYFSLDNLEDWGLDVDVLGGTPQGASKELLNLVEDEVPNPSLQVRSKLGDVFLLGRHRLVCGDSTQESAVRALMTDRLHQADMVFTDPPYNVNYSSIAGSILNDNLSNQDFVNFLTKALQNYYNLVLRDGGSIYVSYSSHEAVNFHSAFKTAGFKESQVLIWLKNHFVLGRQDYHHQYEPILYGWKEGQAHYFIEDRTQNDILSAYDVTDLADLDNLKKEQLLQLLHTILDTQTPYSDVILCDKPERSELHPTMKPIKLIAKLLTNSSKPNDLVVDLFGGSGSTLIACEQLARTCYTMELDPKYCDVIIQRWQNLTGQTAIRAIDQQQFNTLPCLTLASDPRTNT